MNQILSLQGAVLGLLLISLILSIVTLVSSKANYKRLTKSQHLDKIALTNKYKSATDELHERMTMMGENYTSRFERLNERVRLLQKLETRQKGSNLVSASIRLTDKEYDKMQRSMYIVDKLESQLTLPKLTHTGTLTKGTSQSSGYDLHCVEDVTLSKGYQKLIATGVKLMLPPEFEAVVRPRSGLAAKYKLSVTNTPGTIDSDYRGEIKVILINHGNKTVHFHKGDRIAQLVILPKVNVLSTDKISDEQYITLELSEDDNVRGTGGFGSTGKSKNVKPNKRKQ